MIFFLFFINIGLYEGFLLEFAKMFKTVNWNRIKTYLCLACQLSMGIVSASTETVAR